MWSQLISIPVKPGHDIDAVIAAMKASELPDSGLISETFLRDQNDPSRFYIVPLFRNEEEARAREADPRRVEATATVQSPLRDILAGPPQFTDLDVLEHWIVQESGASFDAPRAGSVGGPCGRTPRDW